MSEITGSSFGEMRDGVFFLRDQPITALMERGDWLGTMALALLGRELKEEERVIFSACLIGAIDHGTAPPSAHVTRVVASCGKPVADSVAAGLLTLGPRHGNAASAAAQWLRTCVRKQIPRAQVVEEALTSRVRLSGFGHAEYERDPRAVSLTELLSSNFSVHPHLVYALQIGDELTRQKGTSLYLNIDGAIGAVVADLGWPDEMGDMIFLIARTVGLCAHAGEEAASAKSYRREGR